MSATPSSKSSRSPASTFSRTGASVAGVSRTAATCLPLPVDDRVRQRFELVAMQLPVEARAGSASVVQRDLPRAFERSGRGNAYEDAVKRSAGECLPHELVLLRSQEERQRRRAVAQIRAGDLAGLDRRARAVKDVVRNLKRHAERDPVVARAASEPARGLEEGSRLERAALEVRLDGRRRIVC